MENSAIIRRTGSETRPLAGRRRSKAQPVKKRTARPDGNGFLNHIFSPVWLCNGNRATIETQFFRSLTNYCCHFSVSLPDMGGLTFPQNIYRAWDAVKDACGDKSCIILRNRKQRAVLATVETMDISYCLFYIPVRPYWKLATTAKAGKISDLVLCLFAYLYQKAEVPFYTDGSFIGAQYEMLEEWIDDVMHEEDEDGKAYREKQRDEIYQLRQAGGHMRPKIANPKTLERLETVVCNFRHENDEELEWEFIGKEFLKLYREYPGRTVNDDIHTELLYPGEEERIMPDQYTGFYWSNYDYLTDDMDSMINNAFQEIAVTDEPMFIQAFDTLPATENNPFDFQNRLFGLMEKLRDLLNKYDHD